MAIQNVSLKVSPEAGQVSAAANVPKDSIALLTFAHGAGAGMNHSFMVAVSEALAAERIATLRFNFPFMENKKGRPDPPTVAHKTIESAIQYAQTKYASLPVFLAGKSFGGRMSSQLLALQTDLPVNGIIFFGFPLHAIKKRSIDRAEHLKKVKQPMLFLQGTRDALAEWDLIEEVCQSLKKATLIKLEGADHSFKKGKENLVPLLVKETSNWIIKQI